MIEQPNRSFIGPGRSGVERTANIRLMKRCGRRRRRSRQRAVRCIRPRIETWQHRFFPSFTGIIVENAFFIGSFSCLLSVDFFVCRQAGRALKKSETQSSCVCTVLIWRLAVRDENSVEKLCKLISCWFFLAFLLSARFFIWFEGDTHTRNGLKTFPAKTKTAKNSRDKTKRADGGFFADQQLRLGPDLWASALPSSY
jgi:hypothetical protein